MSSVKRWAIALATGFVVLVIALAAAYALVTLTIAVFVGTAFD